MKREDAAILEGSQDSQQPQGTKENIQADVSWTVTLYNLCTLCFADFPFYVSAAVVSL